MSLGVSRYVSVNITTLEKQHTTFMYNTLHGRIPRYLSGDCQVISDASRRLRSSDTFTFALPRTRTRLGDRLPDHRYGTVCRQICA